MQKAYAAGKINGQTRARLTIIERIKVILMILNMRLLLHYYDRKYENDNKCQHYSRSAGGRKESGFKFPLSFSRFVQTLFDRSLANFNRV